MLYILYDTATGTYPGLDADMTPEHAQAVNNYFRTLGSSERWIVPSCDAQDCGE